MSRNVRHVEISRCKSESVLAEAAKAVADGNFEKLVKFCRLEKSMERVAPRGRTKGSFFAGLYQGHWPCYTSWWFDKTAWGGSGANEVARDR